jgi:16S rRNA (guanine527-N7)-methyltransferase
VTPADAVDPEHDDELIAVLRRSQRLGYIGGTDLAPHLRHALGFAVTVGAAPRRALDLGSGGGLPGLVLARHWVESSWLLLDGSQTRTTFLDHAVRELDLEDRVTVVRGRAEEVGHEDRHRGAFDLVVARSFGPPAVVAECAAPFLEVGGTLVVSEPPDTGDRWAHPDELAELGLERQGDAADAERPAGAAGYQVLRQVTPCPPRYPRRVGIPVKRPLFTA